MIQLRPYQQQARTSLSDSLARYGSAVLCMPTGSGKTVVFCDIAKRVVQNNMVVMVMCDRKELIYQAEEKLNANGLYPTLIMPGEPQVKNSSYVASVDTLKRRELPAIDVLICDEAHKQTFDKIVKEYRNRYPKLWIIGATATPIRAGRQNSLHEIYHDIIEPITINELIEEGNLVPAVTYGPKIDLSEVEGSGSDYSEAKLFQFYNKQVRYDGVIENYLKYCQDGPTIVFNVNREHSRKVVKMMRENGIKAAHIDGSYSKSERRKTLNLFHRGHFDVISNCGILTTGYDHPPVKNIMLNRATKSLALYLQMCGRGSRPFPGKEEFKIIDLGSNVYQHGFWEDAREWELKKKKRKKGIAPVKNCPQCEAILHASARSCQYCGYIFPIKTQELAQAEFEQVTHNETPKHLRKPYSRMSESELHEFAAFKGYKKGWVFHQLRAREQKNNKSEFTLDQLLK